MKREQMGNTRGSLRWPEIRNINFLFYFESKYKSRVKTQKSDNLCLEFHFSSNFGQLTSDLYFESK